ncbi:phosphotransferase family protein [Nocardia australiensis]|uniref:phosphotransferase family protein n=1 Tax=Nocardia australiensis TaxID=2887191 RepID=UPI001D15AF56|nr:phosphotransferase [Nocardia australiensis]
MTELPLPGGAVNGPVRVGDTVRRRGGPQSEFVRRLLDHFERQGWSGAPRGLGVDDQGRDVLTFVDGYVAWRRPRPREVDSVDCVAAVARLVRQFHDLTAGTGLTSGQEVVCHNDLAPNNTVYRRRGSGVRPVAFIDWDLAAPGARIDDVAHVCWQFLDLGPTVVDPFDAGRRMRTICEAYGLADRSGLVETVLWWQDRCWRGIIAGAGKGDVAMVGLRDDGAVRSIQEAAAWVVKHRDALETALFAE